MNEQHLNDRNQAEAFARRTRCNLQFIENAGRDSDSDVHRVTQITLSLLGLVVFPWERRVLKTAMQGKSIAEMNAEGWPKWEIILDECEPKTDTLGRIVYHLRNAVAHGRLTFSSNSRKPEEVEIIAEDALPGNSQVHWRAQIRADQLRDFCIRLLNFIECAVN